MGQDSMDLATLNMKVNVTNYLELHIAFYFMFFLTK